MTTPRYHQQGCPAGSQVCREAWSPDYAWIVNFNNGNVNNNHRNNNAFVRAVRRVSPAGECQGDVSLQSLYRAWHAARQKKRPSQNQLAFELHAIDNLLELQSAINDGTWSPGPTTCFIAKQPKAREIHAPDFADRVVHHWLVPQLDAVYEPRFIHDSYANRVGKGTHAAVRRLQAFTRQVASGQGGGWYLQLDVHNFFNSIHRPTLWCMLKPQLLRAGIQSQAIRATHALLRRDVTHQGVTYLADATERAAVPPHKRLENAPPGCGLPIGNLSSQFFANVYLDALDQFVKHTLKAKRYLRYVDDFVLVHHDRAQLERWKHQIEQFLGQTLRLGLKADQRLRPLGAGIDFLGYVVYPTHTRVRRRVVTHARQKLDDWSNAHVRPGMACATPEQFRQLDAIWASYAGHFRHANAQRLRAGLLAKRPWLGPLVNSRRRFSPRLDGKPISVRITACKTK